MPHIHRFFVDHTLDDGRDIVLYDRKLFHQLTRVLRCRPGDEVIFFDNSGFEYQMRIILLQEHEMRFFLLNKHICLEEPAIQVYLYQSLLKTKGKFELILQKATEVGIYGIIPLRTEHNECKGSLNRSRNIAIIREAAEQSHRGIVPLLYGERMFTDALKEAPGIKLLFDPQGKALSLVASSFKKQEKVSIFIGPEGGFSPHELDQAKCNGAICVTCGGRILRSETAGIVFPAIVLYAMDNH